ncbi:uL13 family ribosomal protein [Patescibacteria group bacterium]|nr:uL13 family ribosomal protein [Patescibacteria group bacterium]MDE1946504.1 uL13 family ribosomal protein [Patescibacteria group bacterium]MDE2011251.1 uL13 family ribosomal protein [Patescibacteria group bacterium]MDE2233334.1 uL13 family ribosomal protein [Patescibacteria group bacterium]
MKYTIDAQGKKIGRIASEAAKALLGKNSTSFAKNKVADINVEIINAGKTEMTAKKKKSEIYVTYTGHRGGLDKETLAELIVRRGMSEVYSRAIRKMLPNNKLRNERMKRLIIKE